MIKLIREYQQPTPDGIINMAEIEVFNLIQFSFCVDTTAQQTIAEQKENLLNQGRYNFEAIESEIFKAYTGKTFISYDTEGNITRVDFNTYVGDGNAYIQKLLKFEAAKDALLYPEKCQIKNDTFGKPDLHDINGNQVAGEVLSLNTNYLTAAKHQKIIELNSYCEQAILAGFTASNGHHYGFSQYDQMNITQQFALLSADATMEFVYWKTEDSGVLPHTREQFFAVCNDAQQHKAGNIQKYWLLKEQVINAVTDEEVQAITW